MEVHYSFLRTIRHEAKHTTRLAKECLPYLQNQKNDWLCAEDIQSNTLAFLDVVQRVYAFGSSFQIRSPRSYTSLMSTLVDYTSTVLQVWYSFPWHRALPAPKLVEMNTWLHAQHIAVLELYQEAFQEVEAAATWKPAFQSKQMYNPTYLQDKYWIPWIHRSLQYDFDGDIKGAIYACHLEESGAHAAQQPRSSNIYLVSKILARIQNNAFPEVARRKEQQVSRLFRTDADITVQGLRSIFKAKDPFIASIMQEKKREEQEQQQEIKKASTTNSVMHAYFRYKKEALETFAASVCSTPVEEYNGSLCIGHVSIKQWVDSPFIDHLLLLLTQNIDTKVFLPMALLWQEALRRTRALAPTKNTPLYASIEAILQKDAPTLAQHTKTTLTTLASSWQAAVKAHQEGISVEAYLKQHARSMESRYIVHKMAQISIPVYASLASRQRHTYVLGKSGSGKTELIKHLVHEDIQAGHGVFVLDPHGDLAQECLAFKLFESPAYKDRLVYISPEFLQEGFIPQYNPFEYTPKGNTVFEQRNALSVRANELAKSFASFFGNDFTPNMKLLLTNSIKLLLEAPDAHLGSLVDMLYPGGTGVSPYEDILHAHHDDTLRQYFLHIFPASRLDLAKMALITRFTEALSNQFFKQMLCTPVSSFPIRDLLKEGKIIVINASQAKLSRDGTHILGALLCAELTIMALERAAAPPAERKALFAYIDECQNFLNQSIDKLLAEGRKYGVHLTMANQFLGQFDGNTRLKQSILANTAIKFCGSSSAKDQQAMAKELHFTFSSDVSLGKGRFVFGMEGHKGTLIQSPKKLLPPIQKNPHYTSRETLKTLISSQWEKYYAPLDTSTGKTKPPSPPNTSPKDTFIPEIDDL